ncbi:hypothetical protein TSUD_373150 [Trifolium subterraneum]|uniref:MULE transposase domain-containing protein n=1 Tax=Trifolium subterraneum TaxID=3900 RepID=A0A2Z6P1S9_TRISU|nr:hypothetical protein TSUD_373150 [Trifolium subterraneum]
MEDKPPQPLDIVPVPVQPPPISIDTGHHFATAAKENSKDDLITWAKKVAQKLKFTIIVRRSDNGGDKSRKPFFVLECERSGKYVPPKKKLKAESTGTRKCGCPFRLRGYYAKETKLWHMTVVNGIHNHEFDTELEGHLVAGRLKPKETLLYRSHVDEGGEYLQDIFFAHPRSLSLLNSFPTVLVMDSTYKTNKYNMPLFEIVGFTSTEMTYNVCFAWLTNEKEDNFIWALQQLRSLVRNEDSLPKVILTDRDTALMNVVGQVFPTSAAMVCRVHVEKNVGSKINELLKVREGEEVEKEIVWANLEKAFMHLLYSDTGDVYGDRLMEFRELYKHMHMGNYTTNRVESAHGVLKKSLEDSSGDLVKGWEAIHHMLGLQFTEIQTQFGQSMSVEEHRYQDVRLHSLLPFKVSRAALDYIYQEAKRVDNVGMDSKKCGCLMRVNYGLQCACLIAKKLRHNQPIRLDEVYIHWKRMCFNVEEGGGDVQDDYSCTAEEMTLHKSMYVSMFDGEDRWKYIYEALFRASRQRTSLRKTVAPQDKWFTFPDMGHIVATIFERVVVQLSKHRVGACETFFPLRGYPPPNPSSKKEFEELMSIERGDVSTVGVGSEDNPMTIE